MNETGGEDYRNIYPGVYLEMAKSLFALNRYEEAENLLIALYGTAPLAVEQSEALWYLGEVYRAQAAWGRAYASYRVLVEQYGGTPYSSRAQARLEELDENQDATLSIEPLYDESLLTGQFGHDAETAGETPVEVPTSATFAIQLGSFSREDNAKVFAEQLSSLGYPSFLVQAEVDDVYYYRVRVGFYESREEAQGVLQALTDLGYSGYILEGK